MSLVDDQNSSQPPAVSCFENSAKLDQKIRLVFPVANVEQRSQVLIEFWHRETGIEDVSNQHRAIEPLHHPPQHRRLSGADFTRHDDQPFTAFNAVVKVGHHFGMRRREVDVARIRCQREWQFFQPVEFKIHIPSPGAQASSLLFLSRSKRVPRRYSRNFSTTCVSLRTKASVGTLKRVKARPAAMTIFCRRDIACASATVNSSGIEARTGK